MNNSVFFKTENGQVHALRFGQGRQLLIALHGFSDRARMFEVLHKALSKRYTTVAIDLPFHGQTSWHKTSFSKEDLLGIISQVLKSEGKTRFSLMGFSFGARLAQGMLPDLASQLDQFYLLSPDGVKTKGMHTAAHTPAWVRRWLFRHLQHPGWFVSLVNIGHQLQIVPSGIQQFIRKNLSRPKRVERAFGCWLSMDSFYLHPREIRKVLQQWQLPTTIYIGSDDTLLHQNALKNLYGDLPKAQMIVLKGKGHRIVGAELAEAMGSQL